MSRTPTGVDGQELGRRLRHDGRQHLALLQHSVQLNRPRADPSLIDPAAEGIPQTLMIISLGSVSTDPSRSLSVGDTLHPMRRILIVVLLAATITGCSSGSGSPTPPPSLTSYPPDPKHDQPYLDLVGAVHVPGDQQKLINVGHAVCASLQNHDDLSTTENKVVAYGFTPAQAIAITGIANGAYCPDTKPTGSDIPTS